MAEPPSPLSKPRQIPQATRVRPPLAARQRGWHRWLTRPGVCWAVLAALLAAGALAAGHWPASLLDWQPQLIWREPWRWWSAAWVHWSDRHLAANLVGTLVLAALGLAARLPASMALAWALAWPLTQLGLAARPELAHFGGLSGVLHAGVAVVVLQLTLRERGGRRYIGWALAVGLLAKVGLEAPWGPALRQSPGWDIALVPWVHASGGVAGALCACITLACTGRRFAAGRGSHHGG